MIGATITPYGCDGGCFDTEQEATRQKVNAFVRTSRLFDGMADFDAAIRDPQNPSRVLPAYQADPLHPNIARPEGDGRLRRPQPLPLTNHVR
nr:hypothetical protein GCM10020092_077110 [Actinoplanes digitatis]